MLNKRYRLAWPLAILWLVAACATRIPFELEKTAAPIDLAAYQSAARTGAHIYEIVPSESLVLLKVGRAGSMAKLGHDHAIASVDLVGLVALHTDHGESSASIAMPLKNLIVDSPAYRKRLGLDSEPSEEDIAGTYSNMQKMLDADTWPWVLLEVQLVDATANPSLANVSITLHGVTRSLTVPMALTTNGERVSVDGQFSVTQSDFGIVPFSALGGLMRVADEIDIQFEVVAKRR